MKYYKDENNQIWAYEDDVPEFGSYTEVKKEVPLEEGDEHCGEEGYEDATKIIIVKILNNITVKEGLISITKEEVDKILAEQEEQNKPSDEEIRANMQPLSRFQARTVLKLTKYSDSTLFKYTDDYFNSLDDSTIENVIAKEAWDTAGEFKRLSPMILKLQSNFGLTDAQVDDMFTQGLTIEV